MFQLTTQQRGKTESRNVPHRIGAESREASRNARKEAKKRKGRIQVGPEGEKKTDEDDGSSFPREFRER